MTAARCFALDIKSCSCSKSGYTDFLSKIVYFGVACMFMIRKRKAIKGASRQYLARHSCLKMLNHLWFAGFL